jgi:16S rRNA (uracil1498-N3)-methyltransferase
MVFVDDLDALTLDEHDLHHLARALRLRAGEPVVASDGCGGWRPTRFTGQGLEADGAAEHEPRPEPELTVGFALVKGAKPELVVQKLTELGVDRIVPFVAARSVVRWEGDRGAAHADRLRRVAREAAMQSRRVWRPEVEDLATFTDLAGRPGAVLAEPGGPPLSEATTTVLAGPEGGWDPAERSDRPTVGLSDGVLRSETAAVVAGALLAAARSGAVSIRRPPG